MSGAPVEVVGISWEEEQDVREAELAEGSCALLECAWGREVRDVVEDLRGGAGHAGCSYDVEYGYFGLTGRYSSTYALSAM